MSVPSSSPASAPVSSGAAGAAGASSFCNSCAVALADAAAVREHYASALHGVNLRRRTADIAPLSAAGYARLMAEQAAREAAAAEAAQEVLYICDACR